LKTRLHIQKIALLLSAFFLFHGNFLAQGNVLELLPGSEKLEYNEKTGKHTLIGNVHFIYQGNTMYCDSAYYHQRSQEVRAYGNVHITKKDLDLYCDSLYYHGKMKKAKLWGNVRVRDQEYKIITDTLEYDADKAVAIYRHGGKVENIIDDIQLTSRIGYLYSKSKNLFFSNKVIYTSPELSMTTDTLQYHYQKSTSYFYGPTNLKITPKEKEESTLIYCESGWYNTETEEANLTKKAKIITKSKVMEGDLLYHYSAKGLSIGKGNVHYTDTTEKISFSGDYLYSAKKENVTFLTGNALVEKVNGADTLYIHADTLFHHTDTLGATVAVTGYYHVKLFKKELQAVCDSLLYNKAIKKMELYHSPILWVKEKTELKGDFMEILLASDSIVETVNIAGNATVLMEIDSGTYYNQIGGKKITAHFRDNEIQRTDVTGNARTVFFPEDTEKNDSTVLIKRMGMNRIYARDLRVYSAKNEVQGITYIDKPDGIFYPMDQLNKEEQFIQGFKWFASLRPKQWSDLLR
jgi:lipopolysaccharide export system protein LptA